MEQVGGRVLHCGRLMQVSNAASRRYRSSCRDCSVALCSSGTLDSADENCGSCDIYFCSRHNQV
jgi:hypothetical protein